MTVPGASSERQVIGEQCSEGVGGWGLGQRGRSEGLQE